MIDAKNFQLLAHTDPKLQMYGFGTVFYVVLVVFHFL